MGQLSRVPVPSTMVPEECAQQQQRAIKSPAGFPD